MSTEGEEKPIMTHINSSDPLVDAGEGYALNKEKEQVVSESHKNAGIFSSTVNLLNTCIGGGILAYPYGYLSTGLLTGVLITIFLGFLASITLLVICYAADLSKDSKIKSYQDVMRHYMGPVGKKVSEIVLTLYLAGACVCFLTIAGDSLQPLTEFFFPSSELLTNRKFLIAFFAVVFVYPLCLLRKVKLLSYPSGLGNLGVAYLGIMIVISSLVVLFREKPTYPSDILILNTGMYEGAMPQFFMSVPIIAFSFQCHVIIMPLYYELKNATLKRMTFVVGVSITITVACYCVIGAFGLLLFGPDTNPDVLLSFDVGSAKAIVGRIAITITSLFSYPMVYFTDRLSIQTLLHSIPYCKRTMFYPGRSDLKSWSFMTLSSILFGIILVVAIVVPDIVTAFGFVGSIGAVTLDFFLPSILMIVLLKRSKWRWRWWLLPVPIVICVVALIMMIGGIGVTIFKISLGNVD